jgi:hypothetical protein
VLEGKLTLRRKGKGMGSLLGLLTDERYVVLSQGYLAYWESAASVSVVLHQRWLYSSTTHSSFHGCQYARFGVYRSRGVLAVANCTLVPSVASPKKEVGEAKGNGSISLTFIKNGETSPFWTLLFKVGNCLYAFASLLVFELLAT